MPYQDNRAIYNCWFGYLEATSSAPAVVSAIFSVDDCANATHGFDTPDSYGTYTAD